MSKQILIDFIQQNIPNIKVAQNAIETISESFEEHPLSKNEYLLKEGKISCYYYLAEGFLRAFTFDTQGNEITTSFFEKGRIIFEPTSFFLRLPSVENIQAISDCKGYYTTYDKLNILFHSTPEFREFARAMLAKEFITYKSHTLAMINKSAEQRYLELMQNNKELFQHAQLKHIASYLGMTDTSLSRVRREFSKK